MQATLTYRLFLIAFSVLALPCSALAAPKTIGTFKSWEASAYAEGGDRRCYIVSRPYDIEPKRVRRGDTYIMVSYRPNAVRKNDISLVIGYPYAKDSSARIEIGADTFSLPTGDEFAWTDGARTTVRMIDAMKREREMVVRGMSQRGTETMDKYSLMGFTAAYQAMTNACQ